MLSSTFCKTLTSFFCMESTSSRLRILEYLTPIYHHLCLDNNIKTSIKKRNPIKKTKVKQRNLILGPFLDSLSFVLL